MPTYNILFLNAEFDFVSILSPPIFDFTLRTQFNIYFKHTLLRLTRQPGTDGPQEAQLPNVYFFTLAEVRKFSSVRTEGELMSPNLWFD
jgi:hypothetical protein